MASIRKKGRSFEVRIKIGGVCKSKTFETLQQCRTWARCAETELSDELKLNNHPDALPTLAQALTRYSIEVLPFLKGDWGQVRVPWAYYGVLWSVYW